MLWFAVAAGGALGAVARHGISLWVQQRAGGATPLATATVNVLGCLALGLLVGALPSMGAPERWRLLLGVGVLGSFTTFSTWSLDGLLLIEQGRWGTALVNVGAQLVLGLVALWLGRALVLTLLR